MPSPQSQSSPSPEASPLRLESYIKHNQRYKFKCLDHTAETALIWNAGALCPYLSLRNRTSAVEMFSDEKHPDEPQDTEFKATTIKQIKQL